MRAVTLFTSDCYPSRCAVCFTAIALFLFAGCDSGKKNASFSAAASSQTLMEARAAHATVVRDSPGVGPVERPTRHFQLIKYPSNVGELAAYVSQDPNDGKKHPAIVWITGGDNNSIGDVWSPSDRRNDQGASAFRKAGIIMMFPSQRGGNDNPGKREGFYGEVDDILSATEYLAGLPYVDPSQIYLGGHSTGGTMAMLVGECSDQYRAVFSLGPVAAAGQYGGEFVYCDVNNEKEMTLRSPIQWLKDVKTPMYVFEGATNGNWDAVKMMADANQNPLIQFFKVPGHDHFSVIAPVAEAMAQQIVAGDVNVTPELVQSMR